MDHVVNPALTLLDTKAPPLRFGHQMTLGHQFGQILWQLNMPVKTKRMLKKKRIINIHLRHGDVDERHLAKTVEKWKGMCH